MIEIPLLRRRMGRLYVAFALFPIVAIIVHFFAAFTNEMSLRLVLQLDVIFIGLPLSLLPMIRRELSVRFYEEAVSQLDLFGRRRTLHWSDIVDVDYESDHAKLIGRDFVVRVSYGVFEEEARVPDLIDRMVPHAAVRKDRRRRVKTMRRRARTPKSITAQFAALVLNLSLLPFYASAIARIMSPWTPFSSTGDFLGAVLVIVVGLGCVWGLIATWKLSKLLAGVLQIVAIVFAAFGLHWKWEILSLAAVETIVILAMVLWTSHAHSKRSE